MKCAICKNKTTWDTSFGDENFIICPKCYNRLNPHQDMQIHFALIEIGRIKREKKEEK